MKASLHPFEGVELRRRTADVPARRRASGPQIKRLVARVAWGSICIAAGGYFLAHASAIAMVAIGAAILLALAGLLGVAAWGLDNTPGW
jgi:hypothetical protein